MLFRQFAYTLRSVFNDGEDVFRMTRNSQWLHVGSHNPWVILVITLLLVGSVGFGAKNLYFRGDYKVFFEPDNPQRVAFEKMQNIFNKSENIAFMVVPKSGTVYQPSTFELLQTLTEASWQIPLSTRVESLANYQHTYAEYDDLVVTDLIREGQYGEAHIQWVKAAAESSPELNGRLVSTSGDVAVVNVTLQLPDGDQTQNVKDIVSQARELRSSLLETHPEHDIYLIGVAVLNNAFSEAAQKDATTLIPAMFFIIAVMIWLLTRSLTASLATMLVIVSTIVVTIGTAGWYGIFLSTATVNVPTMVTTLAVADCIHIIVSANRLMVTGLSKQEALAESLRQNLKPITITSVTTAIGFLMLNFSAVPILAHLGNLTALGVMLAFLFSVVLLPALLTLLPFNPGVRESYLSRKLEKLGSGVNRRYKLVLITSSLLLLGSVVLASNNELNDVVVKYFDKSNDFRIAVDTHEEKMGGMSTIDFVVYTGEEYGVTKPEVLEVLDEFTRWLKAQSDIQHVLSFSDTIKRLNKNMNNDEDGYYVLPESQELASQYLLLYEMSLPFGLDINNQVSLDKSSVRIITVLNNLGSKDFTDFENRAHQWFEENTNGSLTLTSASPALMFAHIGERNMNNMVWGTLLALVLISFLLVFALRSWRLGIVSLLTNLIPAGVGFGLWALLSGEINMALSVVLSMTLGIIVDDTVHFLAKYQYAIEKGESAESALEYVFSNVGVALVTTTVVLGAGFAVLTFSDFVLNADMGLLTVIIIVAALVVDMTFLPALLLWLNKKGLIKRENGYV